MVIIFIIVIFVLVGLLFGIPRLLVAKKEVQQFNSPAKPKIENKYLHYINLLDDLFNKQAHQPKSIITFRGNPTEEQTVFLKSLPYDIICLSQELVDDFKCLQFSTDIGAAAIVRSLKPKYHIDNRNYENLSNFVRIIPWEALSTVK